MGYRSRFTSQSSGKQVEITDLDITHFLQPLETYQCLPTDIFHAIIPDVSQDWKDKRTKVFYHEENTPDGGKYLDRMHLPAKNPRQLFHSPDVHMLTKCAVQALDRSLPKRPPPLTQFGAKTNAHFRHKVYEACFLASFVDLGVKKSDIKFIPWHEILSYYKCPPSTRDSADPFELPLPPSRNVAGKQTHLKPDNLFGLHYPPFGKNDYKFFAIEIDCGTEPYSDAKPRNSSIAKKIKDYHALIDAKVHQTHLGIPNLYPTFVTTTQVNMRGMIATLHAIRAAPHFLFNTFRFKRPSSLLPMPTPEFFSGTWHSTAGTFYIPTGSAMPPKVAPVDHPVRRHFVTRVIPRQENGIPPQPNETPRESFERQMANANQHEVLSIKADAPPPQYVRPNAEQIAQYYRDANTKEVDRIKGLKDPAAGSGLPTYKKWDENLAEKHPVTEHNNHEIDRIKRGESIYDVYHREAEQRTAARLDIERLNHCYDYRGEQN